MGAIPQLKAQFDMRKILILAAATSLLAVPALAQSFAEPTVYGTVGYAGFKGDEADLGAITARVGAKLHSHFGVEAEGSIGVKDDDLEVSINGSGKYELKHDIAAYAVGFLPINEQFELFARIGYGTSKIDASPAGVSVLQDGSSVNYGLGASYLFDGSNGIRADWTRRDFTENRAGEADVWSVGYLRRF